MFYKFYDMWQSCTGGCGASYANVFIIIYLSYWCMVSMIQPFHITSFKVSLWHIMYNAILKAASYLGDPKIQRAVGVNTCCSFCCQITPAWRVVCFQRWRSPTTCMPAKMNGSPFSDLLTSFRNTSKLSTQQYILQAWLYISALWYFQNIDI